MRAMAEASRPVDFTTYREMNDKVNRMFAVDWDVSSDGSIKNCDEVEPSEEVMARLQKQYNDKKKKKDEGNKKRGICPNQDEESGKGTEKD